MTQNRYFPIVRRINPGPLSADCFDGVGERTKKAVLVFQALSECEGYNAMAARRQNALTPVAIAGAREIEEQIVGRRRNSLLREGPGLRNRFGKGGYGDQSFPGGAVGNGAAEACGPGR